MKFILSSLFFLGVWGCNSPVPNESNYRGQLPATRALTREIIQQYANRLAATANFPISSVVNRRNGYSEGLPMIELSVADNRDIVVTITGDESINSMFVTISGKVESERARSIGNAAKSLFAQIYPDGQFMPFERKGGPFGP